MPDDAVEVRHGDGRRVQVTVRGTVELGRDPKADVVLNDPAVSRRHLALTASPAGLLATDLGSSNGTYRNGARLEAPSLLEHGDVLRIGEAEVVVLRSLPERAVTPRTVAVAVRASRPPAAPRQAQRFVREGDVWALTYGDAVARVRDAKGMHHLARLLAEPRRELHVLDLVGGATGALASAGAGAHLDDAAKATYRVRLADIEEDLAEADRTGDIGRAARLAAERDAVVDELARAVGLAGRDRVAGSDAERARSAVSRSLRNAVDRIAAVHPPLGEHLARAVRTGTYCAYDPDPGVDERWEVVTGPG